MTDDQKPDAENTQKTERPRLAHAWRKGQSGNPGGRPKRTFEERELIEACRAKVPAALKVLVHLMHRASKEAVRLAAAQVIIERGYGRAHEYQELNVSLETPDQVISKMELARELAFFLRGAAHENRAAQAQPVLRMIERTLDPGTVEQEPPAPRTEEPVINEAEELADRQWAEDDARLNNKLRGQQQSQPRQQRVITGRKPLSSR